MSIFMILILFTIRDKTLETAELACNFYMTNLRFLFSVMEEKYLLENIRFSNCILALESYEVCACTGNIRERSIFCTLRKRDHPGSPRPSFFCIRSQQWGKVIYEVFLNRFQKIVSPFLFSI